MKLFRLTPQHFFRSRYCGTHLETNRKKKLFWATSRRGSPASNHNSSYWSSISDHPTQVAIAPSYNDTENNKANWDYVWGKKRCSTRGAVNIANWKLGLENKRSEFPALHTWSRVSFPIGSHRLNVHSSPQNPPILSVCLHFWHRPKRWRILMTRILNARSEAKC